MKCFRALKLIHIILHENLSQNIFHCMATVVMVIVARDTQVTRYTGHMTADSISASLPYYNTPVVQQLNDNSVKEFITTCNDKQLSGVLGIFPETTTTSECDHVIYTCYSKCQEIFV